MPFPISLVGLRGSDPVQNGLFRHFKAGRARIHLRRVPVRSCMARASSDAAASGHGSCVRRGTRDSTSKL